MKNIVKMLTMLLMTIVILMNCCVKSNAASVNFSEADFKEAMEGIKQIVLNGKTTKVKIQVIEDERIIKIYIDGSDKAAEYKYDLTKDYLKISAQGTLSRIRIMEAYHNYNDYQDYQKLFIPLAYATLGPEFVGIAEVALMKINNNPYIPLSAYVSTGMINKYLVENEFKTDQINVNGYNNDETFERIIMALEGQFNYEITEKDVRNWMVKYYNELAIERYKEIKVDSKGNIIDEIEYGDFFVKKMAELYGEEFDLKNAKNFFATENDLNNYTITMKTKDKIVGEQVTVEFSVKYDLKNGDYSSSDFWKNYPMLVGELHSMENKCEEPDPYDTSKKETEVNDTNAEVNSSIDMVTDIMIDTVKDVVKEDEKNTAQNTETKIEENTGASNENIQALVSMKPDYGSNVKLEVISSEVGAVNVERIVNVNETYKALAEGLYEKIDPNHVQILRAFDLNTDNTSSLGSVQLNFTVGEENNGKKYMVGYQNNQSIYSYNVVKASNGMVKLKVSNAASVMIAQERNI